MKKGNFPFSVFKVQEGFKEAVDKRRRIALRNKSEITGKCKSLAAWDKVCSPKSRGGLGVLNISAFNEAQMIKFLHKFYNQTDTPWVKLLWSSYYRNSIPLISDVLGSFWWRDLVRLIPSYKDVVKALPGSGSSIAFWHDDWYSDPLCTKFSRAFSFAIDKDISLQDFVCADDHYGLFALPLSAQAFQDLQDILHILANLHLNPQDKDLWMCHWGSNAFSTKRYYQLCFPRLQGSESFEWIWRNKCTPKIKGFIWLLNCDRLNTRDMMDRRNCNRDGLLACVLYNANTRETRDHLFFNCTFSNGCWIRIGINWSNSDPDAGDS